MKCTALLPKQVSYTPPLLLTKVNNKNSFFWGGEGGFDARLSKVRFGVGKTIYPIPVRIPAYIKNSASVTTKNWVNCNRVKTEKIIDISKYMVVLKYHKKSNIFQTVSIFYKRIWAEQCLAQIS